MPKELTRYIKALDNAKITQILVKRLNTGKALQKIGTAGNSEGMKNTTNNWINVNPKTSEILFKINGSNKIIGVAIMYCIFSIFKGCIKDTKKVIKITSMRWNIDIMKL